MRGITTNAEAATKSDERKKKQCWISGSGIFLKYKKEELPSGQDDLLYDKESVWIALSNDSLC